MNEYLKYLILAIIQGVSEILPISSSAHLILASEQLQLPTDLTLSILLHLGSALAVMLFFRKKILQLVKGFFKFITHRGGKEEFKIVMMLVLASIPAGIAGVLLEDYIESRLTSQYFIGMFLVFTGLILIFVSKMKNKNKKIEDLRYHNALSIGLFQMIGILPGISRSGITYAGTKINNLDSQDASEFIFLMFIPVSLGSAGFETLKLATNNNVSTIQFGPLALALVVVMILTYLSLMLFLKVIKKNKMYYFSYYLLPLGLTLMMMHLYWYNYF